MYLSLSLSLPSKRRSRPSLRKPPGLKGPEEEGSPPGLLKYGGPMSCGSAYSLLQVF